MSKLRDRRQRHDRFYRRAKRDQFASRAVYKLAEMDVRFQLVRPGNRILDLGCWPGSWLQYCAEKVGSQGYVVGLDRKRPTIALPPQVTVITGDVYDIDPAVLLKDGKRFDVVLSDMAPDTTGNRFTDATRSVALVERALDIAASCSGRGAHFLGKVLMGHGFDALVARAKASYRHVKLVKPEGTRKHSTEQYIVAREKKE